MRPPRLQTTFITSTKHAEETLTRSQVAFLQIERLQKTVEIIDHARPKEGGRVGVVVVVVLVVTVRWLAHC